jgi:aldose 1-epimerase
MKKIFIVLIAVATAFACTGPVTQDKSAATDVIDPEDFDTVVNGKQIGLYTLQNDKGVKIQLTNYGARIVSLYTPDKNGLSKDIVLGFDNIAGYLADPMYLGCIVGRYANRIDQAKFTIGSEEYQLFKNEKENTLHGGKEGLDKKVWDVVYDSNTVTFSYLSPDREEGYPGNLAMTKSYTLTPDNKLRIEYTAETDKATVINLSNHTYFNLKGEGDTTILDHYFKINADHFTPVDNEWIPTGEIAPVAGTPFDFTEGKQIGRDILSDNEQLKNGLGYDHNWVLTKESSDSLTFAAKLWEESTGRYVSIATTEPGFQFYSGNFMNGTVSGKSGLPYRYRAALIFETQHFPDSPNHENFPSTLLNPGETYYHLTEYEFGVVKD